MAGLRGQKLDKTLFHDTIVMTLPVPDRKGRNEASLDERDDLLIARYVYYKLYHSYLRYEVVIDEKIRPVVGYIMPYTISKRIDLYSSEIQKLRNENPPKNW